MDEASGGGWVELRDDGSLNGGEFGFHNGYESSFIARPWTTSSKVCQNGRSRIEQAVGKLKRFKRIALVYAARKPNENSLRRPLHLDKIRPHRLEFILKFPDFFFIPFLDQISGFLGIKFAVGFTLSGDSIVRQLIAAAIANPVQYIRHIFI